MTLTTSTRPLRAIVVDDTPDLRTLLCLALESSGEIVVVAEAGNGLEGVQRVEEHLPDLVLLDLAMPVMDGLEALPHLRRLCPEATIIVLSGFGAGAMAARAVAAGADGYLQKGASAAAILDYVRRLVGYGAGPAALTPVTQVRSPVSAEAVGSASVDLAPFGVLVAEEDPGLTVVSVNPRAAILLGEHNLVGDPLRRRLPELAALLTAATADDGQTLQVATRILSVVARRGDGLVHVYLQPRPAEEEAAMLRRAIATTAHEIRNPVTVLVGMAETTREQVLRLSPDQWDRLRDAAVRQARLLESITSDLLTAAQAHRGTVRLDVQRVDLKAILDAVTGQFDDVQVDLVSPSTVLADPFRVQQILTNLLNNARKYGSPPVVVRTRRAAGRLVVEVADRGPGIPESFRAVMFEEFTRADVVAGRGTGLGLYVVRSLVEAHGGTVFHTPREGGGSVFTLDLQAMD